MKNTEFISKVRTGGGCLVDLYMKKESEKMWKLITINEDGPCYYTIFMDEYRKFLKENNKMLEEYYACKMEPAEDVEQIFWIATDGLVGIEDSIRYDYFEEHENLHLYLSEEEKEEIEEGAFIDYFRFTSSVREEICKDLMEIYCCR